VSLACFENGYKHVIAVRPRTESSGAIRLQVLDDGAAIQLFLDGEPVNPKPLVDSRLASACRAGFGSRGGTVSRFEAHPREIRIPDVLRMQAPWLRVGSRVVLEDDFAAAPGDIQNRQTPIGAATWERIIGRGIIETTGFQSAKVQASVQKPCPGRTAYALPWQTPDFADLEVVITPSGEARGKKEQSTAGFILYQDERNYMICNFWLSDSYAGASLSTFYRFKGWEDLYDAVWTNVNDRIAHGKPTRLRLCCDGAQFTLFLDDEPVLYRAFSDVYSDFKKLRIHKVGLVANWEWGCDTGSTFQNFKARN
jgi:hypothetical protein